MRGRTPSFVGICGVFMVAVAIFLPRPITDCPLPPPGSSDRGTCIRIDNSSSLTCTGAETLTYSSPSLAFLLLLSTGLVVVIASGVSLALVQRHR
jgi:hypothetical protein